MRPTSEPREPGSGLNRRISHVRLEGQAQHLRVLAHGVEVVQQDAHAHAAPRGLAHALQQHLGAGVGVDRVVLQVQRALRAFDQRQPAGEARRRRCPAGGSRSRCARRPARAARCDQLAERGLRPAASKALRRRCGWRWPGRLAQPAAQLQQQRHGEPAQPGAQPGAASERGGAGEWCMHGCSDCSGRRCCAGSRARSAVAASRCTDKRLQAGPASPSAPAPPSVLPRSARCAAPAARRAPGRRA